MFKTIIGIVIATVVVIVAMACVDKVTTMITNSSVATSVSQSVDSAVEVTITGEVIHTGTYLIPLQKTLQDLLLASGGTTSNADVRAFDTSVVITSNTKDFYIAPLYDNSNTCALSPITKVCLNTATKEALGTLTAITSTVAEAIVNYRESNGNFHRLEEIQNIKGIGPATFEKCKNYLTLHE